MHDNLIDYNRVDTHDSVDRSTDFIEFHDCIGKLAPDNIIPIYENYTPDVVYTIGITVYKRANFLKQCVESAVSQSSSMSFEVIVVDDDPTKGNDVEKVMNDYKHHPLVSYYKKRTNEGLMGNMNRCISMARGSWVLLIHDDDWLFPNYLQAIDKYRIAHSRSKIFVPSHTTYYFGKFVETKSKLREWICRVKRCWHITPKDFVNGTCATPTGALYHKQTFLDSGGFNADYGMAADYCFFARFVHQHEALRVNDQLFNYRWAENESLNPTTILNFKKLNHYIAVYLLSKTLNMPDWIVSSYEGERLFRDFHGDVAEMHKVMPPDEVEYYVSRRRSIVFRTLNTILKMLTFIG